MPIHQFATSLTYGDAISDEMLEIRKALQRLGHESEIFVKFYDPRLAHLVRDYREYRRQSSARNTVIFHFSIGSAVSKMFFRIPDRKVMIYHNITPYAFFLDNHRILTRECYKGRLELRLFTGKVGLALGDSEYNRRELEEAGYAPTGVLPIVLDFSKFDRPGDPLTAEIYGKGRTTILYVGRVIPAKKFEDVIKAFYWYKTRFNRDSRLILAGDTRGMERYTAGLFELVARLRLSDVHFTGHIEFDQLVALYRLADVYLSLSAHEGFGVPLLEAFYLGLPVAALASGAVEETMNGGGALVRAKDPLRTAALLDRIVSDTDFKARLVASGRRALEKYSPENIGRILAEHLRRAGAA